MEPPESHPRYTSLMTRDKLVKGWEEGLVATQGLIAHGRGEAFDYLLGERTTEEGSLAERVSAAMLLSAEHPVISVNGNVGALVPEEIKLLSDALECPVEINIFHRTKERVSALADRMRDVGCRKVFGERPDRNIPGLDHARAMCTNEGIFTADVVLVPLEDGDRCQALKDMGKRVITIDLNPLSRTARSADITIVDNLIRAVPAVTAFVRSMEKEPLLWEGIMENYDNVKNLENVLSRMAPTHLRDKHGPKRKL
ncbi:MAG: phosphopantothenate/pantothenate synthetase [Thermoplasmata archaeon]|nr:phosphopantothenate/pantothenate synthetase [Thermoplasmata archaeon]